MMADNVRNGMIQAGANGVVEPFRRMIAKPEFMLLSESCVIISMRPGNQAT